MKKIVIILSLLMLLVGCSKSSPLLDLAKAMNNESITDTLVDEADLHLSSGYLNVEGVIGYPEVVVNVIEDFKNDDSLEFKDDEVLYYETAQRVYQTISENFTKYESDLEATYAGEEFEDGIIGIYFFEIPEDWNLDQSDLDTLNSFGPDVAVDYLYVNQNILVLISPFFVENVDEFLKAIDPIIEKHMEK